MFLATWHPFNSKALQFHLLKHLLETIQRGSIQWNWCKLMLRMRFGELGTSEKIPRKGICAENGLTPNFLSVHTAIRQRCPSISSSLRVFHFCMNLSLSVSLWTTTLFHTPESIANATKRSVRVEGPCNLQRRFAQSLSENYHRSCTSEPPTCFNFSHACRETRFYAFAPRWFSGKHFIGSGADLTRRCLQS